MTLPTDLPRLDELEALLNEPRPPRGTLERSELRWKLAAAAPDAVRLSRALADALDFLATALAAERDCYPPKDAPDPEPLLTRAESEARALLEAIGYKPQAASPASKEEGNG